MLAVYDVCRLGKTDNKYLEIMSSVPDAEKYDLYTVDKALFVPLDQVYDLMTRQPDPDTVSRQAVLDAVASASQKAWDTLAVDDVRIVILSDAENAIAKLPPSPSRPHGQWIDRNDNVATCSVCGDTWGLYRMLNFCPNCGADMRQEGGAV